MTNRWIAQAMGAALAVWPISAALPGLHSALRKRRVEFPHPWLLVIGSGLWLVTGFTVLFSGGGFTWLAQDVVQFVALVAVWYVCAALGSRAGFSRSLATGLAAGLAARALFSVVMWLSDGGRVAGWAHHPNTWSAGMLLPVFAVFVMTRAPVPRCVALASAVIVAAATGSRTAIAVLVFMALTYVCSSSDEGLRSRPWSRFALGAVVVVVVLAVLALVQPRIFSSLGDLRQGARAGPALLGVAQPLGVEIASEPGGVTLITRQGLVPWHRLQAPLILFPGTEYVLSIEIGASSSDGSPGLLGVASSGNEVRVERVADTWDVRASGHLVAGELAQVSLEDTWTRLEFGIATDSDDATWLWVGPAPDLSGAVAGAWMEVRAFTASFAVGSGPAISRGEDLPELSLASRQALARRGAFAAAIAAFRQSPWFGRPMEPFTDYFRAHPASQQTAVPAHPHNELLAVLYHRGLVGTLGLLGMVSWLLLVYARRSRPVAVTLAVVLVLANTFDTLLWSAGMIYVLGAMCGAAYGSLQPPEPEMR